MSKAIRTVPLDTKIYVAGDRGMVGSAIVRRLKGGGYSNVLTAPRNSLDLCNQNAVTAFLRQEIPDYIVCAAARVGGIQANSSRPAEFLYENLLIEANLVHGAKLAGTTRMLFLGSSCIYPRDCPQPIREDYLLTGPLEPTNEAYAIAKIAGIKLCEAYNTQYKTSYVSVMPTNLYGPNDNYDLVGSHVLPALLRRTHEAKVRGDKELTIWGTGRPLREFLHVDDLADACVFLMERDYSGGILNIGTGKELSIGELAKLIAGIVGYSGELVFDTSKPDGTPRKLLDVGRLSALGWTARISLEIGIRETYADFLATMGTLRGIGTAQT